MCLRCHLKFPTNVGQCHSVSVLFDGVSLSVCIDNVHMTFGQANFENRMYSHCQVFSRLNLLTGQSLPTVVMCLRSGVHHDPPWFNYVDECYEDNLNRLSASVLCTLAQTLVFRKTNARNKRNYVCIILSYFSMRRTEIALMSDATLFEHFTHQSLPPSCARNRCILVAADFYRMYGVEVADALRIPPPITVALGHPHPSIHLQLP